MKTTTLPLRNLMNRSLVRAFLLVPLLLGCFALAPQAQAVCQQGCDLTNGNTFLGDDALISNTSGIDNTAVGSSALTANTTGIRNTAIGFNALENNTAGLHNTATGWNALLSNTTGNYNTANGVTALYHNTTGSYNTANGFQALWLNQGSANTANGVNALLFHRDGDGNTADGGSALFNLNTGSQNIALGNNSGSNLIEGNHNIYIGNRGVRTESGTIRIGNIHGISTRTFIAGISGATVPTGVAVIVDADGRLGTTTSSERFKDAIKPMDTASEAILALKPVTFHYKEEIDPDGIPQFGLVAEQVEKVNPNLVARDAAGKAYTVRYEAVNAMLLNEFLKEHRKVEQLEKEVAALTAGLQKVSAQLEMSKPVLQTIANNQ
jgi:hypothetical protein